MATWNPTQYLQFGNERLRPALDLLGRIPSAEPRAIYDLGCGTGSASALLKERWPEARVTGVDSSESMLERARAQNIDVEWQQSDLNTWEPAEPSDLIYSNAVFHWLDDHDRLFPRLVGLVKSGGVLAVQMPNNFSAPSHTNISAVVRGSAWEEKLEPHMREHPVEEAPFYYNLLRPHCSQLDLWETTYMHVLEGEDPVAEWTQGTILRPLMDNLSPEESKEFLAQYSARVRKDYPKQPDGKTILPFRRLFIMAVR